MTEKNIEAKIEAGRDENIEEQAEPGLDVQLMHVKDNIEFFTRHLEGMEKQGRGDSGRAKLLRERLEKERGKLKKLEQKLEERIKKDKEANVKDYGNEE